jgi:prepilin-type N-terminal cleavage/methylation domain-containing protein
MGKFKNDSNGFTLIELIVVIAILGIILAIAVPSFIGVIAQSKVSADIASLNSLNKATDIYEMINGTENGDVFDGITTDYNRMNELVTEGYLNEIIVPQYEGSEFNWDIDSQVWTYYNAYTGTTVTKYTFSDLTVADYKKTGTWTDTDDGFYSNYGLLFIENDKSEYTINTTATLNAGTSGGYGILFETSIDSDNKDSGYALQFDRGLNAIVVRERENGVESSPIKSVSNKDNSLIPASKTDEWWSEEHDIKLVVSDAIDQDGKKSITVYIDNDLVMENFVVDGNSDSTNNYTGFRSWTTGTTYKEMTIE